MAKACANDDYYTTYRQAAQDALEGRAMLKALRQEGEKAATRARREATGTLQEKLAAISAAWAPFLEQIAQVEADIATNEARADEYFDAWKGLTELPE